MGFRFWRTVKLAPGIRLNMSGSGPSVSFGPRGAKVTIGPSGVRTTAGIPGSGISYTKQMSWNRPSRPQMTSQSPAFVATSKPLPRAAPVPEARPSEPQLSPGEAALLHACMEQAKGNADACFNHLQSAVSLPDGAFLAGLLALQSERAAEATTHLKYALDKERELGRSFAKIGVTLRISLPITEEIAASVGADIRAVLLALVECYQRQQAWEPAVDCLQRLLDLEPNDIVVKVSLADLLMEANEADADSCREIVRMSEGMRNESDIHATMLLYRARALRTLGSAAEARVILGQILSDAADRSEDLLRAVREELGRASTAT